MTFKLAGLGMALQEPENLVEPFISGNNDERNDHTLVTVNASENIYKEISIDFENADLTVVKIERLSNPHLWKRYITERDLIIQQRSNIDPAFKINEKYLYHGTSAALKSSICEEGLDSRMSKQGCFGKGIYFSDYPRKCVKYAEKGDDAESFILLMRVILGTPKVYEKGQKDRELVREPEKISPYTGYRFYDSVEGCPVNHKEFVVYESRRALVDCIISYSKKQTSGTTPITLGPNVARNDVDNNDIDSDFSDNDSYGSNYLDDQRTASSEDEDSDVDSTGTNSDEGEAKNLPKSSAELLLKQKKKEFRKKTLVTDEHVVDQYLLRGNLDVALAIKLYNEKPTEGELAEQSPVHSKLQLEMEQAAKKPETLIPGSQDWAKLNDVDKEACIKALVDDFLSVTGLTEDNDYVRKRLELVNYNLDLAILAHYEEM